MTTEYEWCIETIDDYDDITDLDFSDKISSFKISDLAYNPVAGEPKKRLVLVRSVGDNDEGLQDREWAYLEGGALPKEFTGGTQVPLRFHDLLSGWIKRG